jgi:hypothetical protein
MWYDARLGPALGHARLTISRMDLDESRRELG